MFLWIFDIRGGYSAIREVFYKDMRVDRHTAHPIFKLHTLKASKTDPFRQGVVLYLGATGRELCPVAAVLSLMVARGNSGGLLFT